MSLIGKRTLIIPPKVTFTVSADFKNIKVIGPLGTIEKVLTGDIEILVTDNKITTVPSKNCKNKALWGTVNSLLKNWIDGVEKNFNRKLLLNGIGFKAIIKGKILELALGFSHLVNFPIPDGVKIAVNANTQITLYGIDKNLVTQTASKIRKLRKVEPYKGKGIVYDDEKVKLKVGKKVASTT